MQQARDQMEKAVEQAATEDQWVTEMLPPNLLPFEIKKQTVTDILTMQSEGQLSEVQTTRENYCLP